MRHMNATGRFGGRSSATPPQSGGSTFFQPLEKFPMIGKTVFDKRKTDKERKYVL
jgi:hypothetical protein